VWLKGIDLAHDRWEEHVIGTGDGDWPHGNVIAPLLPGGRAALVCGYHEHKGSPPQIFEVPDDPREPWPKSVIADVPYGEELRAFDLDGDGKLEVIVGEHDPFKPYRSQCRLYAYKQADPQGIAWARFPLDDRFEHHDGAKMMELNKGKCAIISHGWMEQSYVHLWELEEKGI
jgi:hypothetical protein